MGVSQGGGGNNKGAVLISVNFSVRDVCTMCRANRILSVNFSVRDVRTIQQQCGANRILSVKFCKRNVRSGQQQCGINHFRSVNLTHVPFLAILGLA